ncbi:hypothetical protein C0J52_13467 [Blattella germanica]|nr:hypothetical protein C0J52_13467 [Blattella germanica]
MPFSQEQRSFILQHYFASRSYAHVKDEFCMNHPDVVVPNNSTITIIIIPFEGMWISCRQEENWAILTAAILAEVRNVIECWPSKALRRLSAGS